MRRRGDYRATHPGSRNGLQAASMMVRTPSSAPGSYAEPDDRYRVGKVRMIVARPQDQKAVPLQPFNRRRAVHDDAWQGTVRSLCDPVADEAVERFELWWSSSAGLPKPSWSVGAPQLPPPPV